MGNPPFIGHHLQTPSQKTEQLEIWKGIDAAGVLDYVTCWYSLASDFIRGSSIRAGFVSTNSISQGEQPGIFWPRLLNKGISIQFAHRTFKWESEARGKAHVHVVIIGFSATDAPGKTLWEYEDDDGSRGSMISVARINPYLFEGPPSLLFNRRDPICAVPGMKYGNKPTDGGHLLMSKSERDELLVAEPAAEKFVRQYIGATEFLDGIDRYCLWLPEITLPNCGLCRLCLDGLMRCVSFDPIALLKRHGIMRITRLSFGRLHNQMGGISLCRGIPRRHDSIFRLHTSVRTLSLVMRAF